jgi:CheY-like chemotaxis protein
MFENYAYNESPRHSSLEEIDVIPNRRKKVMIIDDDQDFRIDLCDLLVNEGYTVMTAKDGEMALNNLIHQQILPDLILVDLIMPIKSGTAFRREQLQLNIINKIPVIFITGFGVVEGENCLLKPFNEKDLLDLVKFYLTS